MSKVEVSQLGILNSDKVRFTWSSNPEEANLYNKEEVLTFVFKT